MDLNKEVQDGLNKASHFVIEGVGQILSGNLDETHGVSSSPGATALAALALLTVGRGFENSQLRGVQWLRQNRQGGWGKFPGDKTDEETTKIAGMVLYGSQGGWKAKLQLLSQARQFSSMILSLGERAVPGLEGPTPEEILLPTVLEDRVLAKLPLYGRPVVVAASLLASDSQESVSLWGSVHISSKSSIAIHTNHYDRNSLNNSKQNTEPHESQVVLNRLPSDTDV